MGFCATFGVNKIKAGKLNDVANQDRWNVASNKYFSSGHQ